MVAKKRIEAIDLFCGAGGTSSGLIKACERLGYNVNLTAINHWDIAISTHQHNHVNAKHLCESLDTIDPLKLYPNRRIDLLVASPECTHHSRARGGKPSDDQSRSSAYYILKFLEKLYVDCVLIENVPEFKEWGPLGANGKPLKSKKGELFQSFLHNLKSLGYRYEMKVVNCANYGDPTTRERLFIMARRGNKKIVWPEHTHNKDGADGLFNSHKKWISAKEIIDWDYPSQSIFTRKKQLCANTMRRINKGIEKFCNLKLESFEPFIVNNKGKSNAYSINKPLATQTTKYHQYLCEPFIIRTDHTGSKGNCSHSINDPLKTITSKQCFGLVNPFIINYYGNGGAHSINKPIGTITTKDRFALIQPKINGFLVDIHYRMLQPHELSKAMSFDDDYKFTGTKEEIVKQIGNAVPVITASMLCESLLAA